MENQNRNRAEAIVAEAEKELTKDEQIGNQKQTDRKIQMDLSKLKILAENTEMMKILIKIAEEETEEKFPMIWALTQREYKQSKMEI